MRRTSIIILILAISFNWSIAQEIEANVIVNMERIEMDNRVNVQTFESDLENYINNNKFTELNWEGPRIPVEISIVLNGGTSGRYSARLLVVSKRTLDGHEGGASVAIRLLDDNWRFEYARYASLTFNTLRYNEITTLIDFYMLLIIGFDLDTYGELDGSAVFERGKHIFQLGSSIQADGFGTFSSPGAFTKFNLITELNDMRYDELRKLFFAYYVDGLDQMAFNKSKALKELDYIIADIARFKREKMVGPSVLLQAFLDAKNLELSQLFKEYPDKSVYDNLMYIDPLNIDVYRQAKEGR